MERIRYDMIGSPGSLVSVSPGGNSWGLKFYLLSEPFYSNYYNQLTEKNGMQENCRISCMFSTLAVECDGRFFSVTQSAAREFQSVQMAITGNESLAEAL